MLYTCTSKTGESPHVTKTCLSTLIHRQQEVLTQESCFGLEPHRLQAQNRRQQGQGDPKGLERNEIGVLQ